MSKTCKVVLNNEPYLANRGDLVLDWALMSGIDLPHDCRSGICGACRVRLVEGRVYGGQEEGDDMIFACQSRIVSDLEIVTEDMPETVSMNARVANLTRLAPDVFGVDVELPKPLPYLPGQYAKLQFRGFPVRSYSPSYPLEGRADDHILNFHIRRFPDGLVSSQLGRRIRVGHRVKVTAPLGSAFLRPDHPGRIVLVASGTGFAPMWSIAVAAIKERPQREMVVIVAARKVQSLYMHAALCRLAPFPNVTIIPVVSEAQNVSPAFRSGRPTDHLPALTANDVVYTCGAPAMTEAVAKISRAAGARCYTDPFDSNHSPSEQNPLMAALTGWLNTPPSIPPIARPMQRPARPQQQLQRQRQQQEPRRQMRPMPVN